MLLLADMQLTVIWHVDDLKMSHMSSWVLDQLLSQLNEVFRQKAPITVNKMKRHDYLGITLDYSHLGKVIIDMQQYIQGALNKAQSGMDGVANTPASSHLFQVNPFPPKLSPQLVSSLGGNVTVLVQMG